MTDWCSRLDMQLDQAAQECDWIDDFHHCSGCANATVQEEASP